MGKSSVMCFFPMCYHLHCTFERHRVQTSVLTLAVFHTGQPLTARYDPMGLFVVVVAFSVAGEKDSLQSHSLLNRIKTFNRYNHRKKNKCINLGSHQLQSSVFMRINKYYTTQWMRGILQETSHFPEVGFSITLSPLLTPAPLGTLSMA